MKTFCFDSHRNLTPTAHATRHRAGEAGKGFAVVANEIKELARQTAGNVAQASQGMGEVNANVAQSSSVSTDIAKEISEITHAANEMANSSAYVNSSSVDLSNLAEKLNEMVGRFKV